MILPSPTRSALGHSVALGPVEHEQIVYCHDRDSSLRAIIAIHDTRLGPALGGTRFYPYASEADALTDVLRLSQGMTYKAAAAGIDLGGGKAVIIGDPATAKTPDLLRAYGRFVQSLSGKFRTAADVGTTVGDLDIIAAETEFIAGTSDGSGDSGMSTAYGVFCAMRTAADLTWGEGGLRGRKVGVEGVGKVGAHLVHLLVVEGARVFVSDPSDASIADVLRAHPDVTVRQNVLDARVDIYAPCALGASLTPTSVKKLRATVVCGAANNQLSDPSVALLLAERGVTWVPDFVANAGGLIQVAAELSHRTPEQVRHDASQIGDTVRGILTRAVETGKRPNQVADEIVEERLAVAGAAKNDAGS